MTNEKIDALLRPGGNLFRFGLYFREKTEKRTGRDASNGKMRKFPLSHGEVQRGRRLFGAARARRAVAPFYRCVVAPVGKGIRARMFQKRRGRGERKEK